MKAYHALVTGDSGSGKTTLLRETHFSFDGLSIWVNHDGATGLSGRGGRNATTVHSAAALRSASSPRVNYKVGKDSLSDALAAAREEAISYRERTGYPAQVIGDEIQTVMGEELGSSHPVKKMLHEDRDKGIRFVGGTQDPSDLRPNYSALKQCRYFTFVGVPSPFHRGFADYFSLPKNEMPANQYEYVVFGKNKPFQWTVEHRARTKEEYS